MGKRPRYHTRATRAAAKTKARRTRNARRALALAVAVTLAAGAGAIWGYYDTIRANTTVATTDALAALPGHTPAQALPAGQAGATTATPAITPPAPNTTEGAHLYLLVGTDSRGGENAGVGAGTADDVGGARADTIMLVNVPPGGRNIRALSILRDTRVPMPVCDGWDAESNTYTPGTNPNPPGIYVKINNTYATGGPQCLVRAVHELTGLTPDRYIAVDFVGLERIVDTLGGITVDVPHPVVDSILGPIATKPGPTRMGGKRALRYARARHVAAEGNGDYGRVARQQQVLAAIATQARTGGWVVDANKLATLLHAVASNTTVDGIPPDGLVPLAWQLRGADLAGMAMETIPTTGTDGVGNEVPDYAKLEALLRTWVTG